MNKTDQLVQARLVQEYGIKPGKTMRFTVKIQPMGKPRMTQRDKWKGRDVVQKYMAYKDEVRRQINVPLWKLPEPISFSWWAWFPLPASWSKVRKLRKAGTIHRVKPDRDNVDKALMDILFRFDQRIALTHAQDKFWDDSQGARLELEVIW